MTVTKNQVKKNTSVIINNDLSRTTNRFGITPEMQTMRGRVFKINAVYKSAFNNSFSIKINGYDFDPHDVSLCVLKKEKNKQFHFDIKELNI